MAQKAENNVDLANLTWPEYARRVAAGAIVFLPVGSLEQHGHHLPLDTDTVIAQQFCSRVAAGVDGIVLPPLAYGARSITRSGGGSGFPGTVNLGGQTLASLVCEIVSEQHRHGVRRLVILLGHGENDPFCIEGVELMLTGLSGDLPTVIVAGWWHVLDPADVAPLFPEGFPGWDLEHAARIETALMMAFAPERIRMDAIGPIDDVAVAPYTVLPMTSLAVPSQGSLSDPRGASAEAGQALVDVVVPRLTARIRETFGLSGQGGD